jgi:diguanylate cyclase (GGDEF)-like protein/PAS domain S-box-containing protein
MSPSRQKKSSLPPDRDESEEVAWVDSAIFGMGSLVGSGFLDNPALDLHASGMDESRMRLAASVFANAHDGIMITDARGRILDINRAFAKNSGYSPDDIIGKAPSLLKSDCHSPDFYAEIWQSLKSQGRWRGEIWNRRKNGHLIPELMSISAVFDAFGELTHYVAIYTDITDLKESQRKLEHLAYHDALTGLPNRALLGDRIKQALAAVRRHNGLVAICFLDLDDFKPVNDTYGHQNGDRLLIEVANRLKDAVRETDTVARIGGDEFALLLGELESAQEAQEILSRLLLRVALPYQFDHITAVISASIGYTLVPGDDGDPDSLLRHADQAMYVAKQEGRNRFHLFDIEQDLRIRHKRENLTRVKKALLDREFRLYYQPKVDMRRGKVVGMEALIRWQHPELGVLVPSDFLLVLGDHPLLMEIGDWAIREALQQLAEWHAQGMTFPVSVNISGSHLLHPEFVTRLAAHLAAFPQLNPRSLELEILETAALEDVSHVSRVISKCRDLGVDFSLDDFGTGYSSLLYLKRLPAKTLKIDQSFVRDMLDTAEGADAIAGILSLAAAFKRKVVAEGVEFIEQGIVLLRLNCDVVQGYAIARPMPADNVPDWVEKFQPDPAWLASVKLPWRRSDFPLLAAEVSQRRWLKLVSIAVERGDGVLLSSRAKNLQESSFGHWLYGLGKERYERLPELHRIPDLHRKTHEISEKIAGHLSRGGTAQAVELLAEQRTRSLELIEGLRALRIAVVEVSRKT